jgi:thiamine biosynthesis lipoprotein
MMQITRRHLILTAAAGLLAGPAGAAPVQVLGGAAFGSTWRLVLPEAADATRARAAVAGVIARVDATLSPWAAASEIARFNRGSATGWQEAGPEVRAVAAESLAVARLTGGAFDPTVGPLVARYGFGPIRGEPGVWSDIALAPDGRLRKAAPHLTLDFCGIAKGHALDLIAARLAALGLASGLIELGGELRALGRHPAGRPWTIGIERPGSGTAAGGGLAFQRLVAPGARALATSGTAAQGVAAGGRNLSHLIDPGTGRPAEPDLASVSVLAATGARADALATALCAMGTARGVALARRLDIPALFLSGPGPDPTETMTGDFAAHVLV